jgi:hypothetical protein
MKKVITAVFILSAIVLSYISIAGTGNLGSTNDIHKTPIDGAQEYKQLYNQYLRRAPTINISGTITVYDSDKELSVKESAPFAFLRSGINSYYKLNYLQFISDSTTTIQLDTVNRYIVLSMDSNRQSGLSSSSILPFESMFTDTSQYQLQLAVVEKDGNQRTLQITSDINPEIKSVIITYNSKSYMVEAVDISLWKSGDGEGDDGYWLSRISYNYGSAVALDASSMIREIVRITEGKAEGLGRYRDYEISVSN